MAVLVNSNGHPITGTTAQRDAIAGWEVGETFYNTTAAALQVWNGSSWGATTLMRQEVEAEHSLQKGAPLVSGFSLVKAANGTKSVVLPPARGNEQVVLKNEANAVLKVFPSEGDVIDDGDVDAGFNMPARSSCFFYAGEKKWDTVLVS